MQELQLTLVTLKQLNELQNISIQTFIQTFANDNTQEDIQKYIETAFHADVLTKELTNRCSAFYFALINNKPIGYLKVNWSKAQSVTLPKGAFEIERIYVLEAYQGFRIGKILFEKAIALAKEHKASFLWLGVWEHNPKAIDFYTKQGMIIFSEHIFTLGQDQQRDILMKLPLSY